jgi:hypothetical protein
MVKNIKRFAIVAGSLLAPVAFATSDADGLIGSLDFTGLAANVSSVIGQAFPVAALAAGVILGLAFLRWVVSMVGHALGGARRRGTV